MMEEIDRFQVPSAVQEAEMQAKMQPLVSRRQDDQLVSLVFPSETWELSFRDVCCARPAIRDQSIKLPAEWLM